MMVQDDGITEAEARALLEVIVAIPSVNPAFRTPDDPADWFGEARLAEALSGWLRANDIAPRIDEVEPARPNLVARVDGTGPDRMIWEGHLDTVQVTGMAAPFEPVLREGKLYGRGAVDDGGCVAAFLLALRALSRDPGAHGVDFVAAMDEEYAYRGVLHHLRAGAGVGVPYTMGVAGEPTSLRVIRACKGCLRWTVALIGRAAHTSRPGEGLNAIDAGRRLLNAFEAEMTRRASVHPLLGRATLVCTGIEAGEGPNTVPPRCTLRFDYRYLPHESTAEITATFTALARGLADEMPGLTVEVAPPFVDSSAMDVPADAAIVTRMGAICAAQGLPDEAIGVPFGSDATKLVNDGGIPTIVFGPGDIAYAHAIDEHVEVAQVVRAARMLVELARG